MFNTERKKEIMNVLSLFDGISCGYLALQRAGIHVDKYFASEIKDIAIKCSLSNNPEIIQIGDITKIKGYDLPKIDLIIGGSPCQDFSNANSIKRGLNGDKSSLFFHYFRLLKEVNPKYFVLENVVMDEWQRNTISNFLNTDPILINSKLLSAQNRARLYWTNIPEVKQPKDKGILLNDILKDGYSPLKKARCLLVSDSRPLKTPVKMFHRFNKFTTLIFKSEEHYNECKSFYDKNFKGMNAKDIVCDNKIFDGVRYLYRSEREILQTLPVGYCNMLTDNEAADVLGDGWTVDVISHIFSYLPIKE